VQVPVIVNGDAFVVIVDSVGDVITGVDTEGSRCQITWVDVVDETFVTGSVCRKLRPYEFAAAFVMTNCAVDAEHAFVN
jgi:hypothetical protein